MEQKQMIDYDKVEKNNKAIFLDRDGTLIIDKNYSFNPDEIEFLPGVIEGLKLLQEKGFLLIIISNQSGIAKGIFTEEQLLQFNNRLRMMFLDKGIVITDILCCPHHPNGIVRKYSFECNCRKPKTELFWSAVRKHNINLERSFAVGDRLRDCAICFESQCNGIIVANQFSSYYNNLDRIVCFSSFVEGINYILR